GRALEEAAVRGGDGAGDVEDPADLPRVPAGGGGGDVDHRIGVVQVRDGGGATGCHPALGDASDEVEHAPPAPADPYRDVVCRGGAACRAGEPVVLAAVGERAGVGRPPDAAHHLDGLLQGVDRLPGGEARDAHGLHGVPEVA